ncbi:uncharacterized protein H6S33_006285 [Morchella sextelata]|uniref:uncharacterized protein n=1 Tax=Morchella sextelata TaxID=1174677 RepID=UPI001D037DF3|nr:uncharacterized protein H6S33_006285 [Morchella sextelata]KAH0604617.1 hypothetical protein H6S33_006285 [Morchella sextelata]
MRFLITLATIVTVVSAYCNDFRLRVAHDANQGLLSGQYLTNQTVNSNATISTKFNTAITAKFVIALNSTELLIPGYDRMCVMPNGRVGFECVGAQGTPTGWKFKQHELGKILVHGDAEDEGWVAAQRFLEGVVEDAEPAWEVYWGKEGVSGPNMEGHSFKVVQECV